MATGPPMMGTLQNPNPNPIPYPNRSPLQNSNPTLNPNPNPAPGPKPPSFEEVSKLFSLPLSDAAYSLGVCPSVLKQVCYDNGLVRWPYRKFLSGKSIEEIKKDDAIEKKQHSQLKVAAERSDSLAVSAVSSSLGPQPPSTNTQGSPGLRALTQPPTKDNQTESSHNLHSSTVNRGNSSIVDEFKYGFPSDGLSSVSFRWWGNKSDSDNGADTEQGSEDAEKSEQQSKDSTDTTVDEEVTEGKKNETDSNTQWASSLSALRKKTAKEGKQALKLGVYRVDSVKTLDRNKKKALLQIFKSSLPSEWADISSES
ncbi:hypothetical protein CDL12_01628 [Handroanthus impetiginosus]|uniref:RWP-RK domain-containing protein n=1 Tax=Handroanthus impetiginosus TaxID=429701 RepID=A0A2G9I786_9LAMI|nr:hypothetical protein CDL12_01628 [Handroanthus impetiginosus]